VPGTPASRRDVWFVAAGVGLMLLVVALALVPIALLIYALQKIGQ
jgi:hypothetical protein